LSPARQGDAAGIELDKTCRAPLAVNSMPASMTTLVAGVVMDFGYRLDELARYPVLICWLLPNGQMIIKP